MPHVNKVSTNTKEELIKQACESCRRRKLKCTKLLPKCKKCQNHGWSCCYTPKIERTPLTRKQLTQMEIRCWKLDRLVARLVTDQTVDELLDTIPDPTEEDFTKKSAKRSKKLLHDGNIITLGPDDKIHDYINQLNIPAKIGKSLSLFSNSEPKHKRSKSSMDSLRQDDVKKENDEELPEEDEEDEENDEENDSFPDFDVDTKTAASSRGTIDTVEEPETRPSLSGADNTYPLAGKESGKPSDSVDVRPLASNIVLNDPLYGLDWKEVITVHEQPNDGEGIVVSDISDGMAALNLNPEGKGYYGIASSSETVRNLNINYSEPSSASADIKPKSMIPILPSSASSTAEESKKKKLKLKQFVLTTSQADEYITAYFDIYHTSYPFIHKKTFLTCYKDSSTLSPNQQESFEILKLTICALGCWCISDKDSDLDLLIYQEARNKLGDYVFEHGNLFITEALILLSNYIQKRDFPNTGWAYLGTAIRHALGLALHENIKGASALQQEIRNRIWWGLYIFDVGTAITWGRPIHLPNLDEIRVNCLKNIPDEEFDLEDENVDLCSDRDYPTIYSGFIAQIQFTHISSKIYNRTLSKKKLTLKECLELNNDIEEFSTKLPDYLSFDTNVFEKAVHKHYTSKHLKAPTWLYLTRYRLIWRVRNLQTVLFKSVILYKKNGLFVKGDSKEVFESITLCLDSSRQTIESVTDYYHKHELHRIAAWYSIYFSFQAIVIPMFCLLKEPNSKFANQWLYDLYFLRMVLFYLTSKSHLCEKFIKLIDKATDKYHDLKSGGAKETHDINALTRPESDRRINKRKLSQDGGLRPFVNNDIAFQQISQQVPPHIPQGALINPIFSNETPQHGPIKLETPIQLPPPGFQQQYMVANQPPIQYSFSKNQDLQFANSDPSFTDSEPVRVSDIGTSQASSGMESFMTINDSDNLNLNAQPAENRPNPPVYFSMPSQNSIHSQTSSLNENAQQVQVPQSSQMPQIPQSSQMPQMPQQMYPQQFPSNANQFRPNHIVYMNQQKGNSNSGMPMAPPFTVQGQPQPGQQVDQQFLQVNAGALQQAPSSSSSTDHEFNNPVNHANNLQAFNALHGLFEDQNVDSSAYLYSLNIQDINEYEFTYNNVIPNNEHTAQQRQPNANHRPASNQNTSQPHFDGRY